ncbi:MAG TPA: winged helix-turn-helix domain-containing protein [Blastocatellia bacterium]|nr:winged helix-turn-helix domain-containing protein [Blastocatellia bacterium]
MAKSLQSIRFYEFGPFRLDTVKRLLLRDGEPVQLAPKAFDTLLALVENAGQVVEKDDLLKQIWPDSFVEEVNLTVYISTLRKVLGESPDQHRFIVTVPRRGYSFVASVTALPALDDSPVNGHAPEALPAAQAHINGSVDEKTVAERETAYSPPAATTAQARPAGFSRFGRITLAAALLFGLVAVLSWFLFTGKSKPQPVSLAGKAIAVLPFKQMNAREGDFLELGMADALITRLSRLEQITVLPTSAIFGYAGQAYDPVAAGRKLRVDAVMQGTVQRTDARVRVTLQLISVADGKPIWADRFDEQGGNLFAVQDSISEQVAQALTLELSGDEKKQPVRRYTENTEAYHAYLRGVYFWNKRTKESLKKSIDYFQQAISHDPNYALAYAGVADASALIALYHLEGPARNETYERARAAALRAIEIDETVAEAHTALALVKESHEGDLPGAEREQQRALELKPNDATARQRYAWFLLMSGQLERAAREMQQAAELDPLSVVNNTAWATFLHYMGETDRAIEQCRKTLEMDPDFPSARYVLGLFYEHKGLYEEALTEIKQAMSDAPDSIDSLEALGHIYAVSGRQAEAQRYIQELEKLIPRNSRALYSLAMVYAGMGDKDRAFDWLEKAAQARADANYHFRYDPRVAALREGPRYENFVRLRQTALARR